MKPLSVNSIESFLKRFDNFRDGELRSIKILSPTSMLITLAGQDTAREFDWISMQFEFSNINNANLIEDSKLSLVDMSDGISIINVENQFAFGIGKCYNISSVKSSTCYIISSDLKYQEDLF